MKNEIEYYYDLKPTEIHQYNNKYKFKIGNSEYILYQYNRKLEELYEIYSIQIYMRKIGLYCHEIIFNKENKMITEINNKNYIMVKKEIEQRKIEIYDISYLNQILVDINQIKIIKRENWKKLWINKIDYFEYQINQFGKKYPIIRESSSYYIGIVENCITLLSNYKNNNLTYTISHNRINEETTTEEYYNPLNFIVDSKVRNPSEYIKKYMYENQKNIIEHIKQYINMNNLTEYEIILFFVRLIYPSEYFDKCEEIIDNKATEKELLDLLKNNNIYENNLKHIYTYIKKIIKIPEIEWLKNK